MKRTTVLLVVVALLLLGSLVLAVLGIAPAMAQTSAPGSPAWYAVEEAAASGGDYRLSSQSWHVSGTSSGTGYRLLGPAAPNLQGGGCCCIFLPCVFGSYSP